MQVKKFLFLGLLLALIFSACKKKQESETAPLRKLPESAGVFTAVVAGQFYPADAGSLREMVQSFLAQAQVPEISGRIFAVLSPHAGYIYSGPVAGYAYKAIQATGKKKFVIIAPSHHYPGPGKVAVLNADYYQTPLGKVRINREKVQKLFEQGDWVTTDFNYFSSEHSAEVQIPFLQIIAGEQLEIVVIVMPDPSREMTEKLAKALLKVFPEPDWIFIASSDLSHYHPDSIAKSIDRNTLNLIEQLASDQLYQEGIGPSRTAELCGLGPVIAVMDAFKSAGGAKVKILDARNSYDTAKMDPERVVGYAAVAFVIEEGSAREQSSAEPEELKPYGGDLSLEQKKELLRIARLAVETYVKTNKIPEVEVKDERLKQPGAAFVTLKKFGELRGCIGHIVPQEPLYLCVRDVACSAAKHDYRFPPIKPEELKDLEYEISVLSPMTPVKDINIIKVGRDGLLMKMGPYQGLLLPQVPVEQGWDRDTFLNHTCMKAGMSPDCWHNSDVQILRFQGLVFNEKDFK